MSRHAPDVLSSNEVVALDTSGSTRTGSPLSVTGPITQLWRQRFLALPVAGLEMNAPPPGRLPRVSPASRTVIDAMVHTTSLDPTHWNTPRWRRPEGVSGATVARIC